MSLGSPGSIAIGGAWGISEDRLSCFTVHHTFGDKFGFGRGDVYEVM